ncbi:MAG: hypothetical protein ACR2OA_15540 [Rubripirellula sp.]
MDHQPSQLGRRYRLIGFLAAGGEVFFLALLGARRKMYPISLNSALWPSSIRIQAWG